MHPFGSSARRAWATSNPVGASVNPALRSEGHTRSGCGMTTFFVDYATSGSSKKLAVAADDGCPMLIGGSLLDFVAGRHAQAGTPSSQGILFSGEMDAGKPEPSQGNPPPAPSAGDTIVIESNFEPHNPDERNAVIAEAEKRRIEIRTLPVRTTGQVKLILDRILKPDNCDREYVSQMAAWAEREGLTPYDHDDLRAVEAIRYCYRNGQTSAKAKPSALTMKDDLQIYQSLRTMGKLHRSTPWVKTMLRGIPLTLLLDDLDVQEVYVQDRKWQLELLLLTIITVRQSDTRNDFDRWLGLYGNGYARLPRSSFIRRAITLARRDCPDLVPAWQYERRLVPAEQQGIVKRRLSQVRRATRKMRKWLVSEGSDVMRQQSSAQSALDRATDSGRIERGRGQRVGVATHACEKPRPPA